MTDEKNYTDELCKNADPTEEAANDTTDSDGQEEIASLRAEIASLTEALRKKSAEADMIRGQLGEFSELFPDVSPEDVPEEVWENAASAGSLAAAYALYHRRREMRLGRVRELNRRNADASTGKVGVDSAKEFFTPDEVRAMSREEVHTNYSKILDSMKKWN